MKKLLLSLAVVLMLAPVGARAAQFRGDSGETDQTISKSENVRNMYVAGRNVTSDATVGGDLVAAGSTVTINGPVEQSVITAGSDVRLTGTVGGNARIGAGTVLVSGTVNQDVTAAGGTVEVDTSGHVIGDLLAAGGQVIVNGAVDGAVRITGGMIRINGPVGGDVIIRDATAVDIGDNAVIKGKLDYTAEKEATISEKAKIANGVDFHRTQVNRVNYGAGSRVGSVIFSLLNMFVLLLVLRYIFPRFTNQIVERAYLNSPNSLVTGFGLGLATLVLAPFVLIFLAVTVIGLRIALVLGLLYLLMLLIAGALGVIILGRGIVRLLKKEDEYNNGIVTILIGLIAGALLKAIPVFGWLFAFFYFAAALGILLMMFYSETVQAQGIRKEHK